MNMRSNTMVSAIAIVLALILAGQPVNARTEAAATPVPFPEAAPAPGLPSQGQLQRNQDNLQNFLRHADTYIHTLHETTERYRAYVKQVQEILASCAVNAEVGQGDDYLFGAIVDSGARQCNDWASAFKRQAADYANYLDHWVAIAEKVQRASGRARTQVDRIRMMKHARNINAEVEAGNNALKQSRSALEPWVGQ